MTVGDSTSHHRPIRIGSLPLPLLFLLARPSRLRRMRRCLATTALPLHSLQGRRRHACLRRRSPAVSKQTTLLPFWTVSCMLSFSRCSACGSLMRGRRRYCICLLIGVRFNHNSSIATDLMPIIRRHDNQRDPHSEGSRRQGQSTTDSRWRNRQLVACCLVPSVASSGSRRLRVVLSRTKHITKTVTFLVPTGPCQQRHVAH